MIRYIRFLKAYIKWNLAGRPVRHHLVVRIIYDDICWPCIHLDRNSDSCSLCGCRIHRTDRAMNKLVWATEECPRQPPFWKKCNKWIVWGLVKRLY